MHAAENATQVKISATTYEIISREETEEYVSLKIKKANTEKSLIFRKKCKTWTLYSGRIGFPKNVAPEFDPTPTVKEPKAPREKTKAEICKAELKNAFPSQKFSVSSRSTCSIDVSWVDGPTVKEVEAIAKKYQNVRYCEASGEILSGGNTFVFCTRSYSAEVFQGAVKQALAENWGMWEHLSFETLEFNEEGNELKGAVWGYENGVKFWFENLVYEQIKDKSFSMLSTVKAEPETQKAVSKVAEINEASQATVTENEELDGVEIRFPEKPSEEIIASLKEEGFRWTRFNKCWYAPRNVDALEYAYSLCEQINQPVKVLALPPCEEEFAFIEPIEIIQCEVWGSTTFPKNNKNDTMAQNSAEIDIESYEEDCKIKEIVVLADNDFGTFLNSLLDFQEWLKGKGTTASHNEHLVPPVEFFHELCDAHQKIWIEGAYEVALMVTNPNRTKMVVVNPQGHDYARYVGTPNQALIDSVKAVAYKPAKALVAASSYTIIRDSVQYEPIAFTTKSPQQEHPRGYPLAQQSS